MVTVDRTRTPSQLSFAPRFNVAVPFIDRHLAEGRGDKVAIRCAAGDVTYAALAAGVDRCAGALLRLGLVRGERLLMVVKDCPEFFQLFWGAIKAGIVPVPLNVILRTADYRVIVEDSGAAALFWSPELSAEVAPAVLPGVRVAMSVDALGDLAAREAPRFAAVPADAMAPCFWLYTSGSTGKPKGAVHRHRDMVVTSELMGRGVLGIGEDDVTFSAAKLFFAYGLGNAMTFPLWAGATTVLLDVRPTARNTLETIERYRTTVYYGVPTLYAAQLRELEGHAPDLSSVRVCVSAGEPLPAELFRRWKQRTGLTILDGLGSTEALNTFLSNRLDDVRPGTSGKPVPGYEVRVVTAAGEAATGEVGRLQVRGGSIAAGYWNDPARTAAAFRDGWLDTGDTCVRDAEGYYRYCGRSDDMLKVGGIWCSPVEIETRLVDHQDVYEAAVIGVPDGDGIMKPEAWVVLRPGVAPGDAVAEALVAHCKARLAHYKFPRRIHFVAELPRTATGKVQRFRLLQEAAGSRVHVDLRGR